MTGNDHSDDDTRLGRRLRYLSFDLWFIAMILMFDIWLYFAVAAGSMTATEAAEVSAIMVLVAVLMTFLSSPALRDLFIGAARGILAGFTKVVSNP